MSKYGATPNVPYTGQQDSNLVDNPRYQGQSAGTLSQGATGPQQESRYGAAPVNSTGTQQGQQHGQQRGTGQGGYGPPPTTGGYGADPNAQSGYGSQTTSAYGANPNAQSGYGSQTTPGYGSNPNAQSGYGSQTASGYGSNPNPQSGYGSQTTGGYRADPNARGPHTAYGSQPTGGYGAPRQGQSEFAKEQPGYGQPGFGAPSEGQHTGALWPEPAPPPNAHKQDLTSQGQGPYGQQQPGQGQSPYGQQQSGQGQGGPYGQAGGYDGAAPGQQQGYNPNVNHPSEVTGFGGGHGHHPQGDQDQLGGGYNTGMATGADAYTQSQPRKEGTVGNTKDAVGAGPNSGYDARTQTGNDAYVHGNHPVGMQDRVEGVNEPSRLGGELPGGKRDGGQRQGEHVPESMIGETRTEPGYDASKGHLPGQGGHHQKLGDTGLGGHNNTGTDTTGIDERRGKGFEDTAGSNNSKLGTGTGTGTTTGADPSGGTTGTGTGSTTGADPSDGATGTGIGTGSGYDDPNTGAAPPKKGLMTKIKEKMHH